MNIHGTVLNDKINKLEQMYFDALDHVDDKNKALVERIERLELELSEAEKKIQGMSETISMKHYGMPIK